MSMTTRKIININRWTEISITDSVIDVVNPLSFRNKDGFTYTYNENLIIYNYSPNEPHRDDEPSDGENDSNYVDTNSMSIMDNVYKPLNVDDAYYGDPILGVYNHE